MEYRTMLSRLRLASSPCRKQQGNGGLRGSYPVTGVSHTDLLQLHAMVYRRPCLRARGGRHQSTLTGPSGIALSAIKKTEGSHEELHAVFKKLQNGSDIRGFALDDTPEEPMNLTPGRMYYVGRAFGTWLRERTGRTDALRVSIGSDPRLSSDLLSASMAAGLAGEGIEVVQFGLCTTPAMFMSCILPKHKCDGAIMVTASHLPKNRNGAKFFTRDGGLGKPDIKEILQAASEKAVMDGVLDANAAWYADHAIVTQAALECDGVRLIRKDDFLEDYAAFLRGVVIDQINHPEHRESPLRGLKIVVNPGNGSGGFFATKILGPLGADVSGSINLEPDGTFPAHKPNPEDAAAVDATKQAVLESGADLGIMLDTDVDRSGFIDRNGRPINRNKYIALAAAIALKKHPGATIVTDSCTSNGLKTFIESLGGRHFRFKKGYKNIIDKGIQLNQEGIDCPLMMETSGHGALRENYFLDDGAYGALKIVIEAVRRRIEGEPDISVLLEDLQEAKEAMEIRIKILADDVQSEGIEITKAFKVWLDAGAGGNASWSLEPENYEGWRVNIAEKGGTNGWLLLRPSLHDPDIVINVESEQDGGMAVHLQHLLSFFNQHTFNVSTNLVNIYISDNSSSDDS